jgi:hypothetical protein
MMVFRLDWIGLEREGGVCTCCFCRLPSFMVSFLVVAVDVVRDYPARLDRLICVVLTWLLSSHPAF